MSITSVAKGAAVVVKKRKSIGKIVLAIILVSVTPILFAAMLFFQMMSAFEPDGVLKSADYVNGEETAIYRSLQVMMEPYYEELKEELAKRREELIEEHTIVYEEVDEDGEIHKHEIQPTVKGRLSYVPDNLIIAYLIMNDGIETRTASINERMVRSFLNDICSIQESDVGDNTFWVENQLLTVDEIAKLYFSSTFEQERFKLTCEAYGEYFDVSQTVIMIDGEEMAGGYGVESLSDVPLYLQYDAAWGNVSYGNGTIKKNGCCPTCLAMVFSYFRGIHVYPDNVVRWSGNNYYVPGAGTAWSIFEPASKQWNVNCTNIGKNQAQMIQALQSGKLIIASMGPGTFTKGGHFIVLTGITASGRIMVNDPNDSAIKRHAEMEFAISLILRECKNMWVFG